MTKSISNNVFNNVFQNVLNRSNSVGSINSVLGLSNFQKASYLLEFVQNINKDYKEISLRQGQLSELRALLSHCSDSELFKLHHNSQASYSINDIDMLRTLHEIYINIFNVEYRQENKELASALKLLDDYSDEFLDNQYFFSPGADQAFDSALKSCQDFNERLQKFKASIKNLNQHNLPEHTGLFELYKYIPLFKRNKKEDNTGYRTYQIPAQLLYNDRKVTQVIEDESKVSNAGFIALCSIIRTIDLCLFCMQFIKKHAKSPSLASMIGHFLFGTPRRHKYVVAPNSAQSKINKLSNLALRLCEQYNQYSQDKILQQGKLLQLDKLTDLILCVGDAVSEIRKIMGQDALLALKWENNQQGIVANQAKSAVYINPHKIN